MRQSVFRVNGIRPNRAGTSSSAQKRPLEGGLFLQLRSEVRILGRTHAPSRVSQPFSNARVEACLYPPPGVPLAWKAESVLLGLLAG